MHPVELFAQALEEYQELNGRIFNIVYYSLVITGPHEDYDIYIWAFFSCCGKGFARAARGRAAPGGRALCAAQRRRAPRSGAERRLRRAGGGGLTKAIFEPVILRL